MRKTSIIVMLTLLLTAAAGCRRQGTTGSGQESDTTALLVAKIQQCSRLYTTEYKVHKIVTYDDQLRLRGSLFDHDFDIPLPLGDRKVIIPMDATLKGYIDFSGFSSHHVWRLGRRVTIVLPDPKVMLTSTKVDHQGVKKYVSLTRAYFSEKELSNLEREGREAIIEGIPELGIVETARLSAVRILIPLLSQLGYREEDVTITFRDDFNPEDINLLLDQNTIERDYE